MVLVHPFSDHASQAAHTAFQSPSILPRWRLVWPIATATRQKGGLQPTLVVTTTAQVSFGAVSFQESLPASELRNPNGPWCDVLTHNQTVEMQREVPRGGFCSFAFPDLEHPPVRNGGDLRPWPACLNETVVKFTKI